MSLLEDFSENYGITRLVWGYDKNEKPDKNFYIWSEDHFGNECWIETDEHFRGRIKGEFAR